jgi:pimeloyl-ACP methyl ester carboxylesterase
VKQSFHTSLIIPGIAMKNSEFSEVTSFLTKFDRPVYCYENLCVGAGARIPRPTIQDFAQYQWQTAKEHMDSGQKINLIGFSMGGMIATSMSLLYPEKIGKLILVSTAVNDTKVPAVSDQLFEFLRSITTPADLYESLKIGFSPNTLKSHPEILEKYFEYRLANGNQQTHQEFISQLQAVRDFQGAKIYDAMSKLKIAKSHLYGEFDQLFGKAHVGQLSPFVPRQIIIPGLGHMMHLENPKLLAEYLLNEIQINLG